MASRSVARAAAKGVVSPSAVGAVLPGSTVACACAAAMSRSVRALSAASMAVRQAGPPMPGLCAIAPAKALRMSRGSGAMGCCRNCSTKRGFKGAHRSASASFSTWGGGLNRERCWKPQRGKPTFSRALSNMKPSCGATTTALAGSMPRRHSATASAERSREALRNITNVPSPRKGSGVAGGVGPAASSSLSKAACNWPRSVSAGAAGTRCALGAVS